MDGGAKGSSPERRLVKTSYNGLHPSGLWGWRFVFTDCIANPAPNEAFRGPHGAESHKRGRGQEPRLLVASAFRKEMYKLNKASQMRHVFSHKTGEERNKKSLPNSWPMQQPSSR